MRAEWYAKGETKSFICISRNKFENICSMIKSRVNNISGVIAGRGGCQLIRWMWILTSKGDVMLPAC